MIADVSGTSGKPFDRSESFDHLEISGRLEKKLTETLSLGGLYQVSEDFIRGGVDFHYKPTGEISIDGEVYVAHESSEKKDVYGGYNS